MNENERADSASHPAAVAPPPEDAQQPALIPAPEVPVEASAPQADAPMADVPAAAAPIAEAPVAETPVAETPVAETPVAEAPPPSPSDAPAAQPAADPALAERRRKAQQAWERVVSARENGATLTAFVTTKDKAGLLVDVGGIRGFLPASQIRVPKETAVDTLVRTRIPVKVLDVDQNRRRIVVSHRRAVEDERRAKRTELLRSLEIGQVREATVVRLADFGAFVDLGGIDGLIPMRELAFERIDKASDVVSIGEKLNVEVLRIEENGKKIALSRKNALPDPWRDHAEVLRPNTTVEGTIVAKEPRLQVEIAPGVVGSVRENDADPNDYEIGEKLEVQVRNVDRRMRRIALTLPFAVAAQQQPSQWTGGFAPLGVELRERKR